MDQQWQQWQYESLARRNHTSNPRLEPVAYDGGRGIATFVSIGAWCFCGFETRVYGLGLLHLVGLCDCWVDARHAFPCAISGPHFAKRVDSEAARGEHVPTSSWWHHLGPGRTGLSMVVAKGDQGDIPSITQAAADLMGHMFPADMKFGKSGSVQCRLLTEVLLLLRSRV